MALSGSRTEFLSADALNGDIQYGRGGGCFVTTRRALLLLLAAIAALIAVGLLVYYFAPCVPGKPGCSSSTNGTTADASASAGRTEGSEGGGEGDGGGASVPMSPEEAAKLRLPSDVRPTYYAIWLQPFIGDEATNNFTFKGTVDVEISCNGSCSSVTLHAKELNVNWESVTLRRLPAGVSSAQIRARSGRALPKKYGATEKPENASDAAATTPASATTPADDSNATATPSSSPSVSAPPVTAAAGAAVAALPEIEVIKITGHLINNKTDTITLNLEKPLTSGSNYSLVIPFVGNVTTRLVGLYRSSYTDKTGTKRWLAATHFEPTSARRAFPCFDEPQLKARFETHVARRNASTSLSNMPLNSSEPAEGEEGWWWDHYPPSPVMSTYLVAVVVSDLAQRRAAPPPAGAPLAPGFDVAVRPDLLPSVDYALQIGPRILAYYTDYFNVSYPLPKMTMAAVPDFAAGAMENWGLVLYRESLMLFDANSSAARSKQTVAEVIAHELAHQWFGNLVTMRWWSDLWLNEGFATYVSYVGVQHVEPTWGMLDKIVSDEMHPVLETDSLNSSHPVSVQVLNPAQISEVFDEVSYNKGACLIRMLNHSLTEPVFRAGLSNYLNKWKYMNAEQDDLWSALTEAAKAAGPGSLPDGASVKDVMDTWTLRKGYPVVTVNRDYTAGKVDLSQSVFRLDGSEQGEAAAAWHVPVSYATGEDPSRLGDTRPRAWLGPAHAAPKTLTLTNVTKAGSDTWLLINVQQTGYYRVNYDATNWRLLSSVLAAQSNLLPTASRAQLVSDALNLARGGHLDYPTALNLTRYMAAGERSVAPWDTFFHAMAFLDDMLRGTSAYGNLQGFVRSQVGPLAQALGREVRPDDALPVRQLRAAAVARLLSAEEEPSLQWARQVFDQWRATADPALNPIPVDMRYSVYCTAVRLGGAPEWSLVLERFGRADERPVERSALLRALMCTRHAHLVVTMLEMSLEQNGPIRLQDSIYVWRSATRNPVATLIAFRYVQQRWTDIYNRFIKTPFALREVIRSSIGGLSTQLDLDDVLAFEQSHRGQFTVATRTMAQALEKLRLKVQWRQRHQTAVTQWLADFANPKAPSASASPTAASTAASASPTTASTAAVTAASTAASSATPSATPAATTTPTAPAA